MKFVFPQRWRRATLAAAIATALVLGGWAGYRQLPGPWVAARMEQAAALAQSGQSGPAAAVLRKVLRRFPHHRDARWQLVQTHLESGRFEHAYLELKTYTELHPERADGWVLIAQLLNTGGLHDEAEVCTDNALAAEPAHAAARELRARIRLRQGHLFGARHDAQTLLAAHPDHAAARLVLEQADAGAVTPGPPDPARIRTTAQRQRGQIAEAHSMIWPGNLAVLRRDSDARVQQADWDGAMAVATRAEQEYPGTVIGPWIRGAVELAQGHAEAAERHFREALVIAPRSSLVAKGLAQAWVKQGSASSAADRLMELVGADPGFAFARRHAAHLYMNGRQPDRAEAILREAIGLASSDAGAYQDLARHHLELDRAGDALEVLRDGLGRFAESAPLMLLRARILDRLGQRDDAIAVLDEIVARFPDQRVEPALLARMLAGTDCARARVLAERLAADAPTEAEVVDAIGWAWTQCGEPARALPWLEAAVRALPDQPSLRYHLGAAHAAMGRNDEARNHLRGALEAGMPFPEQPAAQKLLREIGGGAP